MTRKHLYIFNRKERKKNKLVLSMSQYTYFIDKEVRNDYLNEKETETIKTKKTTQALRRVSVRKQNR